MRKFFIISFFLLSSISAFSQFNNAIGVSIGNIGNLSINLKEKDKGNSEYVSKGKLNYKNTFTSSLFYETRLGKMNTQYEVSYSKLQLKDKTVGFYVPETSSMYSFFIYGGNTINNKSRFQIPYYLGIGFDYFNGVPFSSIGTFSLNLGAKINFLFFITNRIGLFAGANISIGSLSKDETYLSFPNKYSLNAGIRIGI